MARTIRHAKVSFIFIDFIFLLGINFYKSKLVLTINKKVIAN